MLTPAYSGTVRANDELAPAVGASAGASGQPQVIRHCLAGLKYERIAVINLANHVYSRRSKGHPEPVAVLQDQIGQRCDSVGGGTELKHNTPGGLLSP